MIGMTRALKITYVIGRYWLFTFLPKPKQGWPKLLFALIPRGSQASRGRRLRLSLEALGPVFVKFGQALSTRRDLLPPDVADELKKLQDQVPPFSGHTAKQIIEEARAA